MTEFIFPLITAIGAIATAVTAGVLLITLQSQKKQLIVSNFAEIMDYIGNEDARKNRRIIYESYHTMKSLLEKYPESKHEPELDKLNESAKYLSAMYDRVGFLLQQDRSLENKIIEWHGFTTGILWKLLEPLHQKWKEKDKLLDYKGFKFVGEKAYCEYKNEVENYLKNREETESKTSIRN